ncbi:hypothetical protein [Paraburkholderia phenoliruptrix]|uniref:hypothetical protein n=1 Tax=Paraburkholderia phenoliruptrix TaxID=252970 RepID=UPI001C6E5125|nr:hypothetical protein [Paraburkholderia phenoliruptrix]MBW9102927.1 hypothetical protein [Paraburkholderia phenoliruptrix]MBW9132901.1 hypothetical protein [Paraburkholderia ginsengiterrae]
MSNVIDIDALRVARKSTYVRAPGECRHMHITLDDNGDIVKCDDCGVQLSAYWAITHFTEYYQRAIAKLTSAQKRLATAQEEGVHLLAARRQARSIMIGKTEAIGPYAEPPVVRRYIVKVFDWPHRSSPFVGREVERTAQRLANGGWHYIEIDTHTCKSREWLSVPIEGRDYHQKLVLI